MHSDFTQSRKQNSIINLQQNLLNIFKWKVRLIILRSQVYNTSFILVECKSKHAESNSGDIFAGKLHCK
jgi:hypothetical protein